MYSYKSYNKAILLKIKMKLVNLIILVTLVLSPFIYLPIISKKNRSTPKGFNWYLVTFSVGIIQTLFYLGILILLKIPL